MRATLSLMGLYRFDNSIFDNFHIPTELDRETLVDNLLLQCGELEIIYPDPIFLKAAINTWSNKNQKVWQDLYNTTLLKYNPLENYDRFEDITKESAGDTSTSSEGHADSTDSSTGESIDSSKAFESNSFVANGKGNSSSSGTNKSNSNGNSAGRYAGTDVTTAHIHGNIGVTTAQQMLTAEREILEYNVYDKIIHDFMREFIIMVW